MTTGGISIAVFASGFGLSVGIALSGTSLLLSLAIVITQKFFNIFTIKQEKHDAMKLLFQSKLDSIANISSEAMQDGEISPAEFQKLLQEVEKYLKHKADISNHANSKIKKITKEQGKMKVKKIFCEKSQTLQVSRVSMPFKI